MLRHYDTQSLFHIILMQLATWVTTCTRVAKASADTLEQRRQRHSFKPTRKMLKHQEESLGASDVQCITTLSKPWSTYTLLAACHQQKAPAQHLRKAWGVD